MGFSPAHLKEYFVSSAVNERERANKLLLNVLPKQIAPILKNGQQNIADYYESASVLLQILSVRHHCSPL